MRIAHIIPTLDPAKGGPVAAVRMFVPAYQRAGHAVELVCLDSPSAAFLGEISCPVHCCGPTFTSYGYAPRLRSWLRKNRTRFDAFVVHGLWQYHGFAARAELLGHLPYAVFTHGMLDPYFNKHRPAKHLKKLLYWIANESRLLNHATAVCFTSAMEIEAAGAGFPFRHWKGVVVPYGSTGPLKPEKDLRQAFSLSFPDLQGRKFLLFLGRIHPKKGCDLLIDAFAKEAMGRQEMDLVIAGPDQIGWVKDLKSQAERLGIAHRIHWPGQLTDDVKWGAYYASHAFILPSHQENFGIAVAEAIACGKPVLLSNKVNIAQEICDAGAGLIEDDTLEGTQRLLRRFSLLEDSAIREMERAAVAIFQGRYRVEAPVQAILNLFQR